MLHEFLVSTDPSAGSPLLTEVGNKFASVGLCEQAGAKNGPAYRGKSARLVISYIIPVIVGQKKTHSQNYNQKNSQN